MRAVTTRRLSDRRSTPYPSPLLHSHEQPRDVRLTTHHHPLTHLARRQSSGPRTAQDTQHVVLRLREAEAPEDVDQILYHGGAGAQHLEEHLLFETLEWLSLLDRLTK